MVEIKYFKKGETSYGVNVHLFCEAFSRADSQFLWRVRITKKESRKKAHRIICKIEASDTAHNKIKWFEEPEHIPVEWIKEVQSSIIDRLKKSILLINLKN